jgi:hypothetical protein
VNKAREELAARKSLLLARSSIHRLELAQEAVALRESLQWRRLAGAVPMRPVLFAALALLAGRTRLAKMAGWATSAITLVRLVRNVRGAAARGRDA